MIKKIIGNREKYIKRELVRHMSSRQVVLYEPSQSQGSGFRITQSQEVVNVGETISNLMSHGQGRLLDVPSSVPSPAIGNLNVNHGIYSNLDSLRFRVSEPVRNSNSNSSSEEGILELRRQNNELVREQVRPSDGGDEELVGIVSNRAEMDDDPVSRLLSNSSASEASARTRYESSEEHIERSEELLNLASDGGLFSSSLQRAWELLMSHPYYAAILGVFGYFTYSRLFSSSTSSTQSSNVSVSVNVPQSTPAVNLSSPSLTGTDINPNPSGVLDVIEYVGLFVKNQVNKVLGFISRVKKSASDTK